MRGVLRRSRVFVASQAVLVTLSLLFSVTGLAHAQTARRKKQQWGEFLPSKPLVELVGDDTFQLKTDLVYADRHGKNWVAAKDSVSNGASIPRVFWSFIGPPIGGAHTNAAIVHDEGCRLMKETWQDVHLMFYEACRCGGVSETKAKIMYAAVYHFGPRWKLQPVFETREFSDFSGRSQKIVVRKTAAEPIEPRLAAKESDFEAIERYVKERNPTIAELQALDPESLR